MNYKNVLDVILAISFLDSSLKAVDIVNDYAPKVIIDCGALLVLAGAREGLDGMIQSVQTRKKTVNSSYCYTSYDKDISDGCKGRLFGGAMMGIVGPLIAVCGRDVFLGQFLSLEKTFYRP